MSEQDNTKDQGGKQKRRMATPGDPVIIEGTIVELVDRMIEYFSRPGAVLARDGYSCYYRREVDGARCAIGCLLPDDVDLPHNEGIKTLIEDETVEFRGAVGRKCLLIDIQLAHDNCRSLDHFLKMLKHYRVIAAMGYEDV